MADFEDDFGNEGKKSPLVRAGGIAVVIAIIAALAVAGSLYFLDKNGKSSTDITQEGKDSDIQLDFSSSIKSSDTKYYVFEDPFSAPLNTSGIDTKRQRYLQVSLAVSSSSSKSIDLVSKHLPRVVNSIEQVLREQDFSTLQTREGKLQLQLALTEMVDGIIMNQSGGSEHINKVLITDFVMQ